MNIKSLMSLGFIVLFLIAPHSYADETRADLTIVDAQGSKHVLTENSFRQLHIDSAVVNDPIYNRHKRYAGYWLSDIFALAGIHPDPTTVWTFTALDGYKASIAVADALQSGAKAFVAIADLDKEEGWEMIPHGKELVSPGPYYLVWQTPMEDVTPSIKLPWPYQMVEISISKAGEDEQKLFPGSNDKSESVIRGYKIFKINCMACHSINLQGGTIGPELNIPKNILEYEDRNFLKKFIDNPSSFRAKSKMAAFNSTLSPQELDDLLDYLAWMGKHKTS
jgi:mono/diheme cytochrome c family protein